MSKSRGTFITARAYLDCNLDPDALRYYFCAKLNGSISDIDFNLSDFVDRINSDLIGKYVNIASRSSKFLSDHFNNKLHGDMLEEDLLKKIRLKCSQVSKHFFKLEYSQAVREIMEASNNVNLFIDREKPWNLAKHAPYSLESREKLHRIVSTSIEAFRLISIMLKPISPKLLDKVEQFLNVKTTLSWESANTSLPDGHKINPYTHLLQRIDKTELESQLKKRAK